ncbi:hypothetical protein ACROYT_G044781 [Oculina patagonica]
MTNVSTGTASSFKRQARVSTSLRTGFPERLGINRNSEHLRSLGWISRGLQTPSSKFLSRAFFCERMGQMPCKRPELVIERRPK